MAHGEGREFDPWVALAEISEYVPYGLFEPVQEYLNATLDS
ncbi:hypothetical protein ACWC9T_21015 [Kitasatospora sp. NPDC001159]